MQMRVAKLSQLPSKLLRKLVRRHPNHRLRAHAEQWIHLHLEDCEPELKNLIKLLPPPSRRRNAIDVGANYGYYSIELHKYFSHVYSFEVNPNIAKILASLSKDISVVTAGLSSKTGSATLYIPMIGEITLNGWASFHKGNCPDAEKYLETIVPIETLDSYDLTKIDFIKIDVEGHEDQVLLGARETLLNNSPVLLIEVKAKNRDWVSNYLTSLGYIQKHYEFQSARKNNENLVFAKQI